MSTRWVLSLATIVFSGSAMPAIAQAGPPAEPRPQVVVTAEGRSVRIVSAYLREDQRAVVRGMVKRAPLYRGMVSGHLHVTAFGPDGAIVQRRTARWQGVMRGAHPAAATYQSDLAVPMAQVARVEVAYAPERHEPVEGFQ